MKELLEDYLAQALYIYQPRVIFYNLGTNVIDFTYRNGYNNRDDVREQVSIWNLLKFVFDKTKK